MRGPLLTLQAQDANALEAQSPSTPALHPFTERPIVRSQHVTQKQEMSPGRPLAAPGCLQNWAKVTRGSQPRPRTCHLARGRALWPRRGNEERPRPTLLGHPWLASAQVVAQGAGCILRGLGGGCYQPSTVRLHMRKRTCTCAQSCFSCPLSPLSGLSSFLEATTHI